MNANQFLRNILSDLKVELADEFDKNFERKGFFGTPWAPTKRVVSRGSLMLRSGDLRKSIRPTIAEGTISFASSEPYAALHNEGGEITVTPNMRRFFWAMYYKVNGAMGKRKDGTNRKDKANRILTAEAQYWKSMALIAIGTKLKVPQRKFLGHHPSIDQMIERVVDINVQEFAQSITDQLNSFGHH